MHDYSALLHLSQTYGSSVGPSEHDNDPYREWWEMTTRSNNNIYFRQHNYIIEA